MQNRANYVPKTLKQILAELEYQNAQTTKSIDAQCALVKQYCATVEQYLHIQPTPKQKKWLTMEFTPNYN